MNARSDEHRLPHLGRLANIVDTHRDLDDVVDEPVDALRARVPQDRDLFVREVVLGQQSVAHGVVDVVVDVRHAVDESHDLPLERLRLALTRVRENAVADLVGEVERARDAERLLVVAESSIESLRHGGVERVLACVSERGVPHVVTEPDRLRQVLVQPQRTCDDARDRGRLERVRHARAVVIAFGVDEDLRLSLEPPERLRMHDPIPVALKRRPHAARIFRKLPPARVERTHCERRQELLSRADHLLEAHGGQRRGTRCGIAAPTKSAANASPSVP